MEKSKDAAEKPPQEKTKKPLADSELDKASGGTGPDVRWVEKPEEVKPVK